MKDPFRKVRARAMHPLSWVWEPLEAEPGFALRSMFGSKGVYLRGRIMLCCSAGEEPWNGVLVCTAQEHHAALRRDYPELVGHPILGKWLYLSADCERFESVVGALIKRIRAGDERIGVVPKPRRRKARPFGQDD